MSASWRKLAVVKEKFSIMIMLLVQQGVEIYDFEDLNGTFHLLDAMVSDLGDGLQLSRIAHLFSTKKTASVINSIHKYKYNKMAGPSRFSYAVIKQMLFSARQQSVLEEYLRRVYLPMGASSFNTPNWTTGPRAPQVPLVAEYLPMGAPENSREPFLDYCVAFLAYYGNQKGDTNQGRVRRASEEDTLALARDLVAAGADR